MFSWEKFWESFVSGGYKTILNGLRVTALIALLGMAIGLVLGSLLAVCKLLPPKTKIARILGGFCNIYVTIFRGTPMMVQLMMFHFAIIPSLHISFDPVVEGGIAFGINSAAYVCEIMRGGIQSVDKGQMEAGRALGLGYGKTMIKIVLPQAVKNVVPTLGNELIMLVKDTSVVGYIAIIDLTQAFQMVASLSYSYFVGYILLAIIYLVIVFIITLIIRFIEGRLRASDRR